MHLFGKYIIIYIIFLIISYDQLKLINGCSIPILSFVYLDIVSRINESFALRLSGGSTNIENKVIIIVCPSGLSETPTSRRASV